MKILWNNKDGGPESRVWCWGFESKRLGSILLLKFGQGSREAYHSHAFNAVSWVLSGALLERVRVDLLTRDIMLYSAGLRPVFTWRDTFHKVEGVARTNWVLTFRGPWVDKWREESAGREYTLTHGRRELRSGQ